VVGGGIVGGASAYHLARRGVRVLLLDKGRIGTSSPAGTWARSGGGRCRAGTVHLRRAPEAGPGRGHQSRV